jgi:tetratricopeptide (TPR) repeat protein
VERDPKKADAKKNAQLLKDRAAFQTAFQGIMKELKGVAADTDPGTVQLYFAVQLEQGNMLFAEAFTLLEAEKLKEAAAKYAELGNFTARMRKDYAAAGKALNEEMRGNFDLAITALDNRVRHGLAQIAYRAGDYNRVLSPAVALPVVEAVRARGKGNNDPIVLKDERVICNLLGLAMRADVQVGKVPEALDVLGLLLRVRPEKGAIDPAGPELETFIRELREQVKTLKAAKDEKKLAETVKNFSLFLNKLKDEQARLNQKSDLIFLANCYASLGQHDTAVKYLEKIERPKIDPNKKLDKLD